MNRQEFNDWLKTKNAYPSVARWCDQHPDLSVQELLDICPRGYWILWFYSKAGYAPEVLAPVAYRAATRAIEYAADALERAGVQHGLRGMVITDAESARAAARAAEAAKWATAGNAKAARAAEAAARAADAAARAARAAKVAAWAADAAVAAVSAARAAWAAETAETAEAAGDAEHKLCADDCRELLPELRIEA